MNDTTTGFIVLGGIILTALIALSDYAYLTAIPLVLMMTIVGIADYHQKRNQ